MTYHPETDYLRDFEVAEKLRITPRFVWKLSQMGKLPKPIKISGGTSRWYFPSIVEFLSAAGRLDEVEEMNFSAVKRTRLHNRPTEIAE